MLKGLQLEMCAALILDDLQQYFSSARTLTNDQRHHFQEKADYWGRLFIRCFGKQHMTHYMMSMMNLLNCFINYTYQLYTEDTGFCAACHNKVWITIFVNLRLSLVSN
jgi:hypothetical protein